MCFGFILLLFGGMGVGGSVRRFDLGYGVAMAWKMPGGVDVGWWRGCNDQICIFINDMI